MKLTAACMLGLLTFAAVSTLDAQERGADALYSNNVRFAIPFRSDDSEIQRLGSDEIRLYVSVDLGANWHKVQAVKPSDRRFTVQAPKDGEYWFCVRTVAANGQLHPNSGLKPELKVIVDTKPPTLKTKLSQPQPGQVKLDWETEGDHLDASSLTLEQRRDVADPWKKIYVTAAASGSTTWNVTEAGLLEVRGRISDKAGNAAVAQDSIRLSAARQNVPPPDVPDFNDPVAGNGNLPEQFPPTAKETRDRNLKIVPSGQPWATTPDQSKEEPAGFSKFPPVSHSEAKDAGKPAAKVVGRRKFRLNYAVDKVGKSGVERVELYITRDGGLKWFRYGEDADRKSPFEVTVPEDGLYGFAIRVHSGAGLAEPPPRPGEKPMIELRVDQTPPEVSLLPALQGAGNQNDQFLIRWKASDVGGSIQGVAIYYSDSPSGQWKTVTDWTADTGRFLWKTPAEVPARVYLRVVVKDDAGNMGVAQTPQPIVVEATKPSATITNVPAC
jgi:hypothetical protein